MSYHTRDKLDGLNMHSVVNRFRGSDTVTMRGKWARDTMVKLWQECPQCGASLDGVGRCIAQCDKAETRFYNVEA